MSLSFSLTTNRCLGLTVVVNHLSVEGDGNVAVLGYTVSSALDRAKASVGLGNLGNERVREMGSSLPHTVGQYCFVNIPSISVLEWHPFTISSAPDDG